MASVVIRSPAIDAAFCSAALASPDLADALALTFAYPVAAQDHRWQTTGKAPPISVRPLSAGLVRTTVMAPEGKKVIYESGAGQT
jgi:hypothetical protein